MTDDEPEATDAGRRKFMLTGIGVMGAGVGAIVAAPALPYVLYPLFEETTQGAGGFIPAGKPSQFSGTPVKVDLFSDRVDAWSRVENVKIGSAWVVELGGELVAFSTVCPHLGCAIDYDPQVGKFKCPCHRSWFSLAGEVEEGPSPRALDRLEVKSEDKLVAIRYERFKQGIADKESIG
jgi:menaquinol-cytochrome c reductase iron-sulfur subunit